MTNILVCFKIIDETDCILEKDWQGIGTGEPDTSYTRRMLGCFDEAAVENALRLKDSIISTGEQASVTAVTINPGYSDHILSAFPAIGVDRTVCIESSVTTRFSPNRTADILEDFFRKDGPFHVVIAGSRTSPGGSGMTPMILSERLELPCITDVVSILWAKERDGIRVVQEQNSSKCVRLIRRSFLCAIGNAEHAYLRIPMLRDKLRADKTTIVTKEYEADVGAAPFRLIDLIRNPHKRNCLFLEQDTPEKAAAHIYENWLKETRA